ncbi:MAG TPA: hypothetical protein VF420_13340 [Casimicrobiaceae bacterium]
MELVDVPRGNVSIAGVHGDDLVVLKLPGQLGSRIHAGEGGAIDRMVTGWRCDGPQAVNLAIFVLAMLCPEALSDEALRVTVSEEFSDSLDQAARR